MVIVQVGNWQTRIQKMNAIDNIASSELISMIEVYASIEEEDGGW